MKLASRKLAVLVCCLLMTAANTPLIKAQQSNEVNKEQTQRVAQDDKKQSERKYKYKRQFEPKAFITTTSNKAKKTPEDKTKKDSPAREAKEIKTGPTPIVNEREEPEYLIGQAEVVVKGNQDPVIRLGLARNGSTVVEFPVSDNFSVIHQISSNVVAVDESPTLATDHYLVFRAGKDFSAPLPNSKRRVVPQAAISVQMQSGMFVTLIFYPVSDVSQMTHRCVVLYSREEVAGARRAAGLEVDLDKKETVSLERGTSKRINESNISTKDFKPSGTSRDESVSDNLQTGSAGLFLEDTKNISPLTSKKRRSEKIDITTEAKRALESSLAAPMKFTRWTGSVHSLSLSALSTVEINEKQKLAVVAVKNTGAKGVRLVGGEPGLEVVTLDKKGKAVLTQSIIKLHLETTSLGNVIPAGGVVYYAIVFESPVLGANQRLRVSLAQTEAADQPAISLLP